MRSRYFGPRLHPVRWANFQRFGHGLKWPTRLLVSEARKLGCKSGLGMVYNELELAGVYMLGESAVFDRTK